MKKIPFLIAALFIGISNVVAQDEEELSVDEIARRMSNPTLPMMNVTSFYEYQAFSGSLPEASDESLHMFALQPPLPFPFKNGKALTVRPLLPILFGQPVYGENGFESSGTNLGNISVDFLYGGTNPETGVLSGVGMLLAMPTATNADIRGEWMVGPSALIGVMKPW